MTSEILKKLIPLIASFLPFILFAYADVKSNVKQEHRYKQFLMPIFAVIYCLVLLIFLSVLGNWCMSVINKTASALHELANKLASVAFLQGAAEALGNGIDSVIKKVNPVYVIMVAFNTAAILAYLILKKIILLLTASGKRTVGENNQLVGVFYEHDSETGSWYIRHYFGQARTFLMTAFYATAVLSGFAVLISFVLAENGAMAVPFYPVFPIILLGEFAFYLDGLRKDELKNALSAEADQSAHITNYVILRKKLSDMFGDKCLSQGTTINENFIRYGSNEQVLDEIEREYGRDGRTYATFIRTKTAEGFSPDPNFLRTGIELTQGKSLLFNTPFYYKLLPYVPYAMQSALLKGGKILIVLGRHGTEEDVLRWCRQGMFSISSIPDLWKIGVLDKTEQALDIGLVTRSGVHDPELHRINQKFLAQVSFVFLVEPSRIVTTAQVGLNLLVSRIDQNNHPVYCSVDRNCDGLVDTLSHAIMTSITEVSATEYPQGICSYMCWSADGEHLQHRLTPGISRYLGMGTELSFVALKNQIESTVWYGGEAFPVLDAHWIGKQYYHDLLQYANLPLTQESFDKYYKASFNLCDEQVKDNSYIVVEDEFYNLFEIKRELSTISRQQGFVNVISSQYMLREYMTENDEIFNADPKAIPYLAADYVRTKRNTVLRICLQMNTQGIRIDDLKHELKLLNEEFTDSTLRRVIWNDICDLFCGVHTEERDEKRTVQSALTGQVFDINTIVFKHEYLPETGKFEDFYQITDTKFKQTVIDDLQNATYIAEYDKEDNYLGTELKGHILQKYLPGQYFTLNGKYYEMVDITADERVLVRRAADHIEGRDTYRQIREYTLGHVKESEEMGTQKTVNGIMVHRQYADFSVQTPAYWRMKDYGNFETGTRILLNAVPQRNYYNKQILKLDFSAFGEAFTDEIRVTLTVLLNEVFRTLFAENQAYIAAVTPGDFDAPLTFSLNGAAEPQTIYILEDSQMDIGLLVAVERNFDRIFQIISDYLLWNDEQITASLAAEADEIPEEPAEEASADQKKKGKWLSRLFKGKKKNAETDESADGGADGPQDEAEKPQSKKEARAAAKEARKQKKLERKAAKARRDEEEDDIAEADGMEAGEDGVSAEDTAITEPWDTADETPETEEAPAAVTDAEDGDLPAEEAEAVSPWDEDGQAPEPQEGDEER